MTATNVVYSNRFAATRRMAAQRYEDFQAAEAALEERHWDTEDVERLLFGAAGGGRSNFARNHNSTSALQNGTAKSAPRPAWLRLAK